MIPYKLPNAAGMKLTVTNTAASLQSLIETASGQSFDMNSIDSLTMNVESTAIRVCYDDNTPTSTKGLKIMGSACLSGVPLDKLQLISTGASSSVSIQLGKKVLI